MIVLFNPTNETFEMMYGGIGISLKPGEKKQVEDPCGKHLLNSHSPRGLCQLIYGDDEPKVAEAGTRRNKEFKKNHVIRYNMMNEQRKMQGLGYIPPTKELSEYGLELGITLLEPYNIQDHTKSAIAQLSAENDSLKKQLNKIMEKLNNLPDKNESIEEMDIEDEDDSLLSSGPEISLRLEQKQKKKRGRPKNE